MTDVSHCEAPQGRSNLSKHRNDSVELLAISQCPFMLKQTTPEMPRAQFYVYILTNKNHTVLYTGITNDLQKRTWEHKTGLGSKFTTRYRTVKLVYFEVFEDPYEAISREKQIKAGPRRKKLALIRKVNPNWRNLAADL